jgi:hypothetical protein
VVHVQTKLPEEALATMAHVGKFDRLLNFRDVGAFVNELTGSK